MTARWKQSWLVQKAVKFLKIKLARLQRFSWQAITYQAALEIDYLTFGWRYKGILQKNRGSLDPNNKLLILSFSDYVAQVKAEAFWAKVLQLHGFTPVMVTNSSLQRALKYYRIFGINQFEFFDKYLDRKLSQQALEEADAFFARSLTIQDIKNYEFHGTRLGAHMLRTFTRSTHKGSVDLSDPDTMRALKTLMLAGMLNVEQAEVLLKEVQPKMIFTHHPLNLGEGDIFEVGLQMGIDTIYWDAAQREDHWLFKRYKKNARDKQIFSLSEESWDLAQHVVWNDDCESKLWKEIDGRYQINSGMDHRRLQEGKQIKTKEEVIQQLGLDPAKKTAIIFSHIVWDTSFLYGEDLFGTYEEWLIETVRAACKNPAVNWVVKLHPANHRKLISNRVVEEPSEVIAIRKAIGDLPDHVKLLASNTDINTFSFFTLTDYCLTVRGTIGIEMPCFGIPVITAGTGRYSGRGFTIDSDSPEDYLIKLSHIQDLPPLNPQQVLLAKKHAYWLFLMRPVKFDLIRNWVRGSLVKYATHPLVTNVLFEFDSLDDLASHPRLNNLAQWVIHDEQLDFYMNCI